MKHLIFIFIFMCMVSVNVWAGGVESVFSNAEMLEPSFGPPVILNFDNMFVKSRPTTADIYMQAAKQTLGTQDVAITTWAQEVAKQMMAAADEESEKAEADASEDSEVIHVQAFKYVGFDANSVYMMINGKTSPYEIKHEDVAAAPTLQEIVEKAVQSSQWMVSK